MRRWKSYTFVALLLCVAMHNAFAQGTAFTYQGRLNQNGAPATGIYDLRFTIYDSSGGAGIVAGPLTQSGIGVTNGLLTTALDFGAGAFTGPSRWLEIAVKTNGGPVFSNLTPRQPFLTAPYAIHSGTASDVASGSVVKSLNALKDNVTLAAGANVTLATNSNTLTISSTGPGGAVWSLNGANTYYNAGNVGIGTPTPAARLYVVSQTSGPQDNTATFYAPAIGPFASHVHYGGTGDWFIRSASSSGNVYLQDSGGNVGIGTGTPARKLTVNAVTYGIEHTDGSVRLGTYLGNGAGWLGTVSNHRLQFFVNDGGASMTIDNAQNVGIGTTAPSTKLDVRGTVTIETGGDATLYTGTSGSEQNRYLSLINSPAFSSASGLKAGGVLVADSYGYSNPTKNQMIVKGNLVVGAPVTISSVRVYGVAANSGTGVKGESPDWIGISGSGAYGAVGTTTASTGYGVYGRSYTGGADGSYAGYFEGNLRITESLLVGGVGTFGGRVTATEFVATSDRNAKANFTDVDPKSILDQVVALPIQTWNFTNQSESVRHMGPMAQDFYAAFNLGHDEKHISTIDADGVALAAIQGLNQKLEEELKRRDAENAELTERFITLEEVINSLSKKFGGGEK